MNDSKRRGVPPGRAMQAQKSHSSLAATLGRDLDVLNERFLEVERRLQQFGVAASVRLPDVCDPSDNGVPLLFFEKQGSRWRLIFAVEHVVEERRLREEALVNASRAVRVAAAIVLAQLVESVEENAAREVWAVQEALAAVDAVLLKLPPKEPEPDTFNDDDIPF